MENRNGEKRAYAAPIIVIEPVVADAIMCSGEDPGEPSCEHDKPAFSWTSWQNKKNNHYGSKRGYGKH